MARIRKRKYKNKILDVEFVEERFIDNKIIILDEKSSQLADWLTKNKQTVILTSYILIPVLIIWGILKEYMPKNFPVVQIKSFFIIVSFFPIMAHYVYLMLEVNNSSIRNFGSNLKLYIKKMPLDLILLICGVAYITIPSNEFLNSLVLLVLITYISYTISKFILHLNKSIKSLIKENDTDKFKMYMQLTNKILLAIITLVGSILTILLTIKQLLS